MTYRCTILLSTGFIEEFTNCDEPVAMPTAGDLRVDFNSTDDTDGFLVALREHVVSIKCVVEPTRPLPPPPPPPPPPEMPPIEMRRDGDFHLVKPWYSRLHEYLKRRAQL